MNETEARTVIDASLERAVPGVELDAVAGDDELRVALDIDSMDFLSFVEELAGATGLEIPEADYPELDTLDGIVAYLVRQRGEG